VAVNSHLRECRRKKEPIYLNYHGITRVGSEKVKLRLSGVAPEALRPSGLRPGFKCANQFMIKHLGFVHVLDEADITRAIG
jgi:hypothetical protein